MSSLCNFMDHPEWTPEQRIAVTLVEVLRLKRALKHRPSTLSTLVTTPDLPPAEIPPRVVASTPYPAEINL